MDSQSTTHLILMLLILGSISAAFCLGRLFSEQKALKQQADLSLLASLWATTETRAIRHAGLVRIIEKHPALTPDKLADFEKQVDDMLGLDEFAPRTSKHDAFMDTFDFDSELEKDDPASLV